jgi:TetR/AcrR family transcriptional repressor of nem operon
MCLCGMLAAEYDTLSQPMRDAVIGFFDENETWLAGVLEEGQQEGSLRLAGSTSEVAQVIVGGLEGALLIARPYGDVARFQTAASRLLTSVASPAPRERPSALL